MIYSALAFYSSSPWHNNHPELFYHKPLNLSTQQNRPLVFDFLNIPSLELSHELIIPWFHAVVCDGKSCSVPCPRNNNQQIESKTENRPLSSLRTVPCLLISALGYSPCVILHIRMAIK